MNFKLLALSAVAALAAGTPARAQQPDPDAILRGARMAATLTVLDEGLSGNLTQGRQKIPVTLFLKGDDIQFQFSEGGKWSVFHMRLGQNSYDLSEIVDGKTIAFPPAKLVQPIAGTDLTYEDLSMRFFYWPDPILEGQENVNGEPCHKIRINKPRGGAGRYETVYVWVHTKYGAFMRIRGHDRNGGLVKEFQVQNVMQVDKDVWTLRKMQVATHDPATGRRLSISDVTFNAPKKTRPRGVR